MYILEYLLHTTEILLMQYFVSIFSLCFRALNSL